ncbi:CLUMA_CG005965, isoform A [Clunio marinus]|uniref:Metallo-beta-lactamase domain-containing protein 1 n=1 Tax=Clunio marinus TaxID=568069 RepID=A0A1J1I0R5_9DIPT|nr:CLUMA_CG005965, isoform A [Clunio marinus]
MEHENQIFELFVGYSLYDNVLNQMKANSSVTLIKGINKTILFDTLTAWDSELLLNELKRHHVEPDNIDYVICSHGHADHVGNLNLFLNAFHFVGTCKSHRNIYYSIDFDKGPYVIDDGIEVIATPGHTSTCASLIVRNTNLENNSSVAIVGDLFEKEEDIFNESLWLGAGSEYFKLQRQNRLKVAEMVDHIIPGHGPMFKYINQSNVSQVTSSTFYYVCNRIKAAIFRVLNLVLKMKSLSYHPFIFFALFSAVYSDDFICNTTGHFPFFVEIHKNDELLCYGTLVHRQWIVTSYQCVNFIKGNNLAIVKSQDQNQTITHIFDDFPTFNERKISLIRVTTNFIKTNFTNFIPISPDILSDYSLVQVVGSGNKTLHDVKFDYFINMGRDDNFWNRYPLFKLKPLRKGSTYFVGSPVISENKLYGIATDSQSSESRNDGYFADLSVAHDWIYQTINRFPNNHGKLSNDVEDTSTTSELF